MAFILGFENIGCWGGSFEAGTMGLFVVLLKLYCGNLAIRYSLIK